MESNVQKEKDEISDLENAFLQVPEMRDLVLKSLKPKDMLNLMISSKTNMAALSNEKMVIVQKIMIKIRK